MSSWAECDVCLTEYSTDQKPVILLCGHTFCMTCIDYIKKNIERRNCPTCRSPVNEYYINYYILECIEEQGNEDSK